MKDTKQKPIRFKTDSLGTDFFFASLGIDTVASYCPNCEEKLKRDEDCENCGQKIDWSK